MTQTDVILRAVRAAIVEVNEFLPPEQALSHESDALLASRLDSLGTVNLLLGTESQIAQLVGRSVSLTDLLEATGAESPLSTVGSFVAFVATRLEQDVA